MIVGPCERDAHPESHKDAEQLDDIRVSDGVKTTEQGVKDGDTGREDDWGSVVHVDDDGQRGS